MHVKYGVQVVQEHNTFLPFKIFGPFFSSSSSGWLLSCLVPLPLYPYTQHSTALHPHLLPLPINLRDMQEEEEEEKKAIKQARGLTT